MVFLSESHALQLDIMKYLFCVLLALFLSSSLSTIHAQSFGVRAGYQIAGAYNDGDQVGDALKFFYAGFYRNRPLGTSIVSLHTGADYFQTGWKEDDDNFRRMHVVSSTIGIRVKLGPVFAQAGPNLNFRVAEQYELAGVDELNDETESNWFDFAAHAAVGVKIFMIVLEARYHYGFIDYYDGNNNAYWQFGAAFEF